MSYSPHCLIVLTGCVVPSSTADVHGLVDLHKTRIACDDQIDVVNLERTDNNLISVL